MKDIRNRNQDQRPRGSGGFTLVELLVVIVIIGILVGLLIPVVGMVMATTREAAISTEVTTIAASLQTMKNNHQVDFPPDFSGPNDIQAINNYMSRLFRYRNVNTDVPRTGMGPDPTLLNNLDPAEALYFWLRGFSSDPANPLFGPIDVPPAAVERTPLYDFNEAQLLDLDDDGFPEYYPRFAAERPYVYLVHYNYVKQFNEQAQLTTINVVDDIPDDFFFCRAGPISDPERGIPFACPRPYLRLLPEQNPETLNPLLVSSFAEPDKFQIISAGLDNDHGVQVPNTVPQFLSFVFPTGPYPDKAHKDNITNFAAGTLEDSQP